MRPFAPNTRNASKRHEKLYAAYELAFTIVQFCAGVLFLVGSWMFFYKTWETPAIWCFVVGSALFVIGPSLKLVRELHYAMIGDFADLAERAKQ
ncbi:YrhK family protein [Oricola sp.]|uniref:YrhK family protein n=1 Tax=Oricola sp. TaxID=1979950 RepID=UPI0025E951B8|nr:YrhK family protein [Oricola sp.]MCI5076303.1 YrhK family protein [Oricola sp.]